MKTSTEQLAVAPEIAQDLQELMKTTQPGSPEEASILKRMRDARKEAHTATTNTIRQGLEERQDTGELRLPSKAAHDLSHYAIEKATSGEMSVPTEAELAEVSAKIGVEQVQSQFFDQEKH